MTSRIGKRTIAILAFIALALSVIVPLSVPKAFSAPDCHRAEAGDYGAKIDKVVSDFTAKIKKDGIYGYGVHNGRVYSSDLDSIVTGFGEGREIYEIIKKSKYSLEDILGEGAFWNGVSGAIRNEDGTTTSDGSFGIFSPKKTVDEAKLKEVITGELEEFLKAHPRQICPGKCRKPEVKDFEEKIDEFVTEFSKIFRERGEYVYRGQRFMELNRIASGFGDHKEITMVIKGNGYTLEDIFGEGVQFKAVPLGTQDAQGYPQVEIHIISPKKTIDEAKFKDAILKELAKDLENGSGKICEPDKDEPIVEPTEPTTEPSTKPTGDNPKPGCKKAEVKDYAAKIEKVVDEIEASKREERVTGGDMTPEGGKSFLRIFTHYEWNTAILRQINPAITDKLILTEEQTKQVFGDGAKPKLTALGPAPAVDEHGNNYSVGEGSETFHAENATKFDREAMTEIITDKVTDFLARNPQEICEGDSGSKPGNDPKPGCKKAEVKDYAAGIEKVVDKIENSRGPESATAGPDVYNWDTSILSQINPAFTEKLVLTNEQIAQAFGEGMEGQLETSGSSEFCFVTSSSPSAIYKFDREAMTKIITDEVSEFLTKNPQEICEEDSDPKPGTDEPSTEPTQPGTTEPTKPGTDEPSTEPTKPGTDEPTTEPTKPGTNPKPGTDSKADAEPADTGIDTSEPAVSDSKTGSSSATDSDSNPVSGAATSPEGEQTVLEGATEAGGLATTGAVGLIALGVSVLLVGAGAALAIRRRKQANV